jgi:hypothetical protein
MPFKVSPKIGTKVRIVKESQFVHQTRGSKYGVVIEEREEESSWIRVRWFLNNGEERENNYRWEEMKSSDGRWPGPDIEPFEEQFEFEF